MLASLPRLAAVYRSRRLDPVLREKLMVAVSKVNACRGCTWAHTRMAIREGISPDELDRLELPAAGDRRERVALAYAIARAEDGFRKPPDPELKRALADTFTTEERRDIDAILHLIINANLTSNTIEAHTPPIVRREVGRFLSNARPSLAGR